MSVKHCQHAVGSQCFVNILREKTQFLLWILPSISLPILVRNNILLFGWILTFFILVYISAHVYMIVNIMRQHWYGAGGFSYKSTWTLQELCPLSILVVNFC